MMVNDIYLKTVMDVQALVTYQSIPAKGMAIDGLNMLGVVYSKFWFRSKEKVSWKKKNMSPNENLLPSVTRQMGDNTCT